MAAGQLLGAFLVLQLFALPAGERKLLDVERLEDGRLPDGQAASDSETALLQLVSARPSSERRPLEVAAHNHSAAGARTGSVDGEEAASNASEALPGARLWLSDRLLDRIALDVFPVWLGRMLEKDFEPCSGSFFGFDWSLSDLRVSEVKLRPPGLSLAANTGLLFGLHGGFAVSGRYSVRGRSWYGALRSEGDFSFPLSSGFSAYGLVYFGISGLGKPAVTLDRVEPQLSPGSVKAGGFFSSSLLSFAAARSLEADIVKHVDTAVRAFLSQDVSEALAELDLVLPVRPPAPHSVLAYDLSVQRIALAEHFAVVDLAAKPMDRLRPERAYATEPAEMPLVPPPGLASSMAALSTSPWAADGALWILNLTGPPAGTAERRELTALLAEEISRGLSPSRSPAGSASTPDAPTDSPFGLALLGRQASHDRAALRAELNSTSGAATTLLDDLHWDLSGLLAGRYGHKVASELSALASELAASAAAN